VADFSPTPSLANMQHEVFRRSSAYCWNKIVENVWYLMRQKAEMRITAYPLPSFPALALSPPLS
jgi:hypothetical protein